MPAASSASAAVSRPTLAAAPDPASMRMPRLPSAKLRIDAATLLGLLGALALIVGAVILSGGLTAFVSLPALLVVFGGTVAVTIISFSGADLRSALTGLVRAVVRRSFDPGVLARKLLQTAEFARRGGPARLEEMAETLPQHSTLRDALTMVAEGGREKVIADTLSQRIELGIQYRQRATAVLRRASEIAPGMGLIGTLVGLVQMLTDLDDPNGIGPAMAVALLTTFYGAVLGTVILAPLASKLERSGDNDALVDRLIMVAAAAMARQEHPRRIETLINGVLPPEKQIAYFK